jgi:hypothetical protein
MLYLKLCLNGEEEKKEKKIKCVAPLELTPDANGRADKNGYFSVRGATQTDALDNKCVAPMKIPLGA